MSIISRRTRRRYQGGLKNFFKLYKPIANSWQMYDNTDVTNITSVASGYDGVLNIQNQSLWQSLVEVYDEK